MRVETLSGKDILPHLNEVAALRIAVFREFPYLYDGDLSYEKKYLCVYADCPESCLVLARDGTKTVGASTGLPLSKSDAEFRNAFEGSDRNPRDIFYFGESVLLPEYRGRGIGHTFFDQREDHAAKLGFRTTAFCAVDRAPDDPRRPADYRPLDAFWAKRGYVKQHGISASFPWKEIYRDEEVTNTLTFWLKERALP